MKFLRNQYRIGNSDARVPVIFFSRYQWPGATTEPGSRRVDRLLISEWRGKWRNTKCRRRLVPSGGPSQALVIRYYRYR